MLDFSIDSGWKRKARQIDEMYNFDVRHLQWEAAMLGWVVYKGFLEMARHLLHLGASTESSRQASGSHKEVARLLIDHCSDIVAKPDLDALLTIAMGASQAETTELFIERHTKVGARDSFGRTTLSYFFNIEIYVKSISYITSLGRIRP